ncbi:MAG: hypothetical protein GX348_04950 [Veillonellaceae bacterium]|jgi:hypothetical protein|nr:hypothetical protein [Veillonellaceae bacterium]
MTNTVNNNSQVQDIKERASRQAKARKLWMARAAKQGKVYTTKRMRRDRKVSTILERATYAGKKMELVYSSIMIDSKTDYKTKETTVTVVFGESKMPRNRMVEKFGEELASATDVKFVRGTLRDGVFTGDETFVVHKASNTSMPTTKLFSVQFGENAEYLANMIIGDGIWYRLFGKKPIMISRVKYGNEELWLDVLTGRPADRQDYQVSSSNGWRHLKFYCASPSNVRLTTCLMMDVADAKQTGGSHLLPT